MIRIEQVQGSWTAQVCGFVFEAQTLGALLLEIADVMR